MMDGYGRKDPSLVPKRIASVILNALKGGVVPRVGLEYVSVGRTLEIESLVRDIGIVEEGGSTFRFIMGRYGSGKSFLLQTVRNYAAEKGFVVADADLSPERRLTGAKGQGLATYRELVGNLSTRSKPDGGALPLILERWISGIRSEVMQSGILGGGRSGGEAHGTPEAPSAAEADPGGQDRMVEARILEVTSRLEGMVSGFDFAKAVIAYWRAHRDGDDDRKSMALRWFRGEYQTKSEARADLGIGFIVGDDTWYDFLKVMSAFMVGAGYKGLIVILDELVNIFKIPNPISRQGNYEKILTIYNDALQGRASHIGFLMGCTPQCVEDRYRGLFSYEALRTRLADGHYSKEGLRDMSAPMIRLSMLSHEEVYVLTEKIQSMHSRLYDREPPLAKPELLAFLEAEYNRVGAETHITPREVIRDFIELLNVLMQNPGKAVTEVLGDNSFRLAKGGAAEALERDEFAEFEI